METKLIKVGNSKGVIIPSKILRLVGFKEKVQISVEENKIILSPIEKAPRKGWDEAIAAEIERSGQPDELLPDSSNEAQSEEWTW